MKPICASSDHSCRALPEILQTLRSLAAAGRARLLGPVCDDYDRIEIRRRAGRVDAVGVLAALRARAEVAFLLPPEVLGDYELAFEASALAGSRLYGPGIDADDPPDVMDQSIQDASMLAGILLPEVKSFWTPATLRGWHDLRKSYWAHSFRYRLTSRGLRVTFVVELDAD